MSERFSIWFVCMGRARIHLIRLTQAKNRVTFNQPIKLIWSTTFFFWCVCFLSLCLFFSVYLIFFPQTCSDREPFMPSRYLPHTLSNLLNRLTCISNICDSILISNGSIVSYLNRWEYTPRYMYLYRFSAMFCLSIMYNNATTFPAHSENFNLKNANC